MFARRDNLKYDLPDVDAFIGRLNALQAERAFFDETREITVARAPGRLDLMGGIADYSGSLVLQYPIREATFAALQKHPEPVITIHSRSAERADECAVSLADLEERLEDYAAARVYFRERAESSWAAYIAGVFLVLRRERGLRLNEGARMFLASDVPEGKGVSSSAALEVATMRAVAAAYGLALKPREAALLCQRTENEIVGAPCGVMDQTASMCGEDGRLLALVCQPAELRGTLAVPAELEIWGLDSGIRHSVAGSDYGSVRAGAFIGYRLLAELAGFPVERVAPQLVRVADSRWRGYLANVTPAEYEDEFRARLPEKISGAEFLARYHGTTDPITVIDPAKAYFVTAPTAHPIYENDRVRRFSSLLREPAHAGNFRELGRLMYASHASYSACGLGSDGTDLLVELVKSAGEKAGLYGAKITGGGSGGTVAVLARRGAAEAVARVAADYENRTGLRPRIFSGSSPGAAAFGFLTLKIT